MRPGAAGMSIVLWIGPVLVAGLAVWKFAPGLDTAFLWVARCIYLIVVVAALSTTPVVRDRRWTEWAQLAVGAFLFWVFAVAAIAEGVWYLFA